MEAGSRECVVGRVSVACVCVCVRACVCVCSEVGTPRSADKHNIHKWREEEGGEAATSSNPSRAPASINHRDCYTMVIPKTISMITRTNKISNCYHPSHLPPVKSEGRRGGGGGGGGGQRWLGEPFIGLPLRSKGLAGETMVKN